METTRRSFLGHLIGFVAATPFLGNFDPVKIVKPQSTLEDFRLAIRVKTDKGFEDLWCPETCTASIDEQHRRVDFAAKSLDITQAMSLIGISLWLPDGRFFTCSKFPQPFIVAPKDRVSYTYHITMEKVHFEKIDPQDWESWTNKTSIPIKPLETLNA